MLTIKENFSIVHILSILRKILRISQLRVSCSNSELSEFVWLITSVTTWHSIELAQVDSSAGRFSAFCFLSGPGGQSSLSDAFRRIIFFFVPSWRPPSHSRCPALTIFAISRHPIFSLLRTPGLLSRLARGHYLIFRLETSHPQEKRSDRGKKADRESPLAVHAEDQRCLRVITFVSASVFLSSRRYQAQFEIFEAIGLPWLDGEFETLLTLLSDDFKLLANGKTKRSTGTTWKTERGIFQDQRN